MLRNGRRAVPAALTGRIRGRLRRALQELAVTITRTATIVAQTRSRLAGQLPDSATRLVSLHDPDARPIRKGRIDRPVEFGYKAQVIDNDDGVIVDYAVEAGNPPDAPQLAPAITRIARRCGRVPRSVTADRGYGDPATDRELEQLGVRTIAIPRRAKISPARRAVEHARGFRKLVKWRTGCEGRISYLKRGYGWDRTRLDGREGASIRCRARRIHPQPDQDQRPGQLTRPGRPKERRPNSALRLFQVEVIRSRRRRCAAPGPPSAPGSAVERPARRTPGHTRSCSADRMAHLPSRPSPTVSAFLDLRCPTPGHCV